MDVLSLRKNAAVSIGGEIRVDYAYRSSKDTGSVLAPGRDVEIHDLSVRHANLRLLAQVHPNIQAFLKLDLSSNLEAHDDSDEILEEAMLVMSAVGGTGLGFFAGKGKAPYGQDITIGMLQSYHHAANQADSSEGRILITDPPDERGKSSGTTDYPPLPPMRPGQFDRSYVAGVSYEWHDRWRFELAAFKPNLDKYEKRLNGNQAWDNGSDIGAAARLWWQPTEELVLQASAMLARSHDMGRTKFRTDVLPGSRGTPLAKAISLGFDYQRGAWRLFGEYQHSWNWNFTHGYATDTWQAGASKEVAGNWIVGGSVEGLHIREKGNIQYRSDYYRVAVNLRHTFSSGLFILAEYGHEWRRRRSEGVLFDKTRGDFIGMRLGLSF